MEMLRGTPAEVWTSSQVWNHTCVLQAAELKCFSEPTTVTINGREKCGFAAIQPFPACRSKANIILVNVVLWLIRSDKHLKNTNISTDQFCLNSCSACSIPEVLEFSFHLCSSFPPLSLRDGDSGNYVFYVGFTDHLLKNPPPILINKVTDKALFCHKALWQLPSGNKLDQLQCPWV